MFTEYTKYISRLEKRKSKHTVVSYKHAIEKFLEHMEIDSLDKLVAVTSEDLRDYQDYLLDNSGLKASSINARFRCIKAFFSEMVFNGSLDDNPFSRLKFVPQSKRKPKYLTEEEQAAIITAASRRKSDLVMVLLMLKAGLRRQEVINLRLSDVDGCRIRVIGKGDKERPLYLNEELGQLLHEVIEERIERWGDEYENVFIGQRGTPFSGAAINDKVNSLCKKAGISEKRASEISPHIFRHTFATNLVSAGYDINVIQRGLGHSNISTTKIYANVVDNVLREAMTHG